LGGKTQRIQILTVLKHEWRKNFMNNGAQSFRIKDHTEKVYLLKSKFSIFLVSPSLSNSSDCLSAKGTSNGTTKILAT